MIRMYRSRARTMICLYGLLCALLLNGCTSVLVATRANPIEDPPGERHFARRIADQSIEIKGKVNMHTVEPAFDDANVSLVSYNGYVLIAGQVANAELKARATEVVRELRDVRRIYNELEIAAPSSPMTRASDTWITTKVKSWLLGRPETPGMRTKVVTENGVVYLLGMVTREEAERLADVAAGVGGVQRVVRLFELIDS